MTTSIFGPLRRWPELHSGGVNVTPSASPSLAGDKGAMDTPRTRQPLAVVGASSAPGVHLSLVPPLTCGHQRGVLTCDEPHHPSNPNGHVYRTGSWVTDKHGDAS